MSFPTCSRMIGIQLKSEGILWIASGMTILLVGMQAFVLVMHVLCYKLKIINHGIDEHKDAVLRFDDHSTTQHQSRITHGSNRTRAQNPTNLETMDSCRPTCKHYELHRVTL